MSARPTRGSRPLPPLLFRSLCPRTPKFKAAGTALHGAPRDARRSPRKGRSDARSSSAVRSRECLQAN
eukprot:2571240-Pyramimonas_sp.AAC.1